MEEQITAEEVAAAGMEMEKSEGTTRDGNGVGKSQRRNPRTEKASAFGGPDLGAQLSPSTYNSHYSLQRTSSILLFGPYLALAVTFLCDLVVENGDKHF